MSKELQAQLDEANTKLAAEKAAREKAEATAAEAKKKADKAIADAKEKGEKLYDDVRGKADSAVKDAKGQPVASAQVIAATDLAYYSGDDAFTLPLLSVGGVGVVGTSTHFTGARTKTMIEKFLAGDLAGAIADNAALSCPTPRCSW